jgi:tetratricopeptide (TPR) repeat protein
VKGDPDDFIAWNQLADRYHRALRSTGEDRFIALAANAAKHSLKAIAAGENPGGLAALVQARLVAHRFADAREGAVKLRELMPGKARPLELLADALTELGEYAEAAKMCDELAKIPDAELSLRLRRSKLAIIAGKPEEARDHFEKALTELAALGSDDAETIAWLHLQLGKLAFTQGDWQAAEEEYAAAANAQPESWRVRDHAAELRGAQGRTAEAIEMYEKLAAKLPRPEFFQALGDLHALAGGQEKAESAWKRAEEIYLRSVESGAVHFLHHLAGFYADSREQPAKAVEFARKDLALRRSIFAYDALAWALYNNGQPADAAEAIAKALATGIRDPHILYHAGLIRTAAGDIAGGKAALQEATKINPRFNTFHVHR